MIGTPESVEALRRVYDTVPMSEEVRAWLDKPENFERIERMQYQLNPFYRKMVDEAKAGKKFTGL